MADFYFQELDLKDAYLISNFYVGDNRGGFQKSFEKDIYHDIGIEFRLNETFTSFSMKYVVRGLHFQLNQPQAKLVSVLSGKVWDVIVDLRPYSRDYKRWVGVELSSDNHKSLYIPRGFAHGFVSLEDNSIMLYQCDGKYDSYSDSGILLDDSDIGIAWPIDLNKAIRSERDLGLPSFKEYEESPMKL